MTTSELEDDAGEKAWKQLVEIGYRAMRYVSVMLLP
jgi:hypothetical protein